MTTSLAINTAVNIANDIGRRPGCCVKYEYDSEAGEFVFKFYRHRCFVSSTPDVRSVVEKMTALVETE